MTSTRVYVLDGQRRPKMLLLCPNFPKTLVAAKGPVRYLRRLHDGTIFVTMSGHWRTGISSSTKPPLPLSWCASHRTSTINIAWLRVKASISSRASASLSFDGNRAAEGGQVEGAAARKRRLPSSWEDSAERFFSRDVIISGKRDGNFGSSVKIEKDDGDVESLHEPTKPFPDRSTMAGRPQERQHGPDDVFRRYGNANDFSKFKRNLEQVEDEVKWKTGFQPRPEGETRRRNISRAARNNDNSERTRGRSCHILDNEEEAEAGLADKSRWSRARHPKDQFSGRDTILRGTVVSTVPKLVGQSIYGVSPVMAALVARRREFHALYIQEGLDLSSKNRKRKDQKGVEKVLLMAENLGLPVIGTSKHDLNMVTDNRPHQGLVLDTSPLEMVNIRELDAVSVAEQNVPVWVALDEVTDPQNLGAIIRSSYFFGAAGVVLCAKNSAPLSGVVSKASAGSLELIELRSCKNMMQFLSDSSDNGWRVLGGSLAPRAVPLLEVGTGEPTVLVLGSEGAGLRPLVERSCTHLIRIPGFFNSCVEGFGARDEDELGQSVRSFVAVESLNVSVAAGVLLHHLVGRSK